MKSALNIRVRAIPESDDSLFAGPERIDSREFRIKNSEIRDVISSILKNKADTIEISKLIAHKIESLRFGTPRPEEDGTSWRIAERHTPDELWPSFTYFVLDSLSTIEWHVALESQHVRSLIKNGELKIDFI